MIISSIDIGTNTILLLIAEVDLKTSSIKPLLNEQRIPRIGKNLSPGNPILPDKVKQLFSILDEYFKITKRYECNEFIVTGTNAFRIATNSGYIISEIEKNYNWKVKIVSGEDEAKLSFLGAASDSGSESILVIDIGGGSTELSLGKNKEILYRQSFPVGVVSSTEKFLKDDPPSEFQINNLSENVEDLFISEKQKIAAPDKVIAIAGTPTTLACIKLNLNEFNEELIEGSSLLRKDLKKLISNLSKKSSSQIKNDYGLVVNGREDIILSGTIILYKIMELFLIEEIIVSTKGIRYGAIIDFISKFKD
jgi:exopolyphosphatase/guanosine-5'-triphosphate,3'-diphosphate pyrophosphatase